MHDPRALAAILERAEAELASKKHPDPYICQFHSDRPSLGLKPSSNSTTFPWRHQMVIDILLISSSKSAKNTCCKGTQHSCTLFRNVPAFRLLKSVAATNGSALRPRSCSPSLNIHSYARTLMEVVGNTWVEHNVLQSSHPWTAWGLEYVNVAMFMLSIAPWELQRCSKSGLFQYCIYWRKLYTNSSANHFTSPTGG